MPFSSYRPAEGASPVPPYNIALLSERDLSLRVPVNYLTHPGVTLSKACFAHDVYEDDAASLCFSNLLASGFRRFIWDLYWDDGRRVWSFCPAKLPTQVLSSASSTRTARTEVTSSSVTVSAGSFAPRSVDSGDSVGEKQQSEVAGGLSKRQTASSTAEDVTGSPLSLSSISRSTSGTAVSTQSSIATAPPALSGLIAIGPYSCTPSIDLPVLTAVLDSYFRNTSDTLTAILTYLVFNLHVAASSEESTSVPKALNSTSLPYPTELVSSMLRTNLTAYLYTPFNLSAERASLNSSWLSSDVGPSPYSEYYNITRNGSGVAYTQNGWPIEGYLEFVKGRTPMRLITGFGDIDPQLNLYNLSGDQNTIFPSGYFQADVAGLHFGENAAVTKGCIFNANGDTLGANNNSFAVSSAYQYPINSLPPTVQNSIPEVANLTSCGISPILNSTILNKTADEDFTHYRDFVYSSIWSWSPGEPRQVATDENNAARIRCAAVDGFLNGRWRVADCTDRHYAACRVVGQPFTWRISASKASYTASKDSCDDDAEFSVPNTVLESRHLFQQMKREKADDQLVWVNFNSLDLENCWVQGVNATCPYTGSKDNDRTRAVVVPVVAAVIVFVVAALTVFIKCAANKAQNSRRRKRRKIDGSEYDGVPQ